jgi:TetR/AcrR family transcriptional regulator, transcriptional repressor for nem operon
LRVERLGRGELSSTAADLMLMHGVEGTSVDHVLARSRTGKSQFSHYFEGKHDLVMAVLDYRVEKDLAQMGDLLERPDDWDVIREFFDAIIEGQERLVFVGACPMRTFAVELTDTNEGRVPPQRSGAHEGGGKAGGGR